jgi:DNA-directed RNA polymerase II subunit RPB1
MSLLCDRMTCNKDMVAIIRSGLLKDNTGVLAKASFETHTDVLLNAARHGLMDPMRGVSASVFVGSTGHYGTAAFGLVLDPSAMEGLEEIPDVDSTDSRAEIERQFGRAETHAGDMEAVRRLEIVNGVANIAPAAAPAEDEVCDDGYDAGF